MTRRHPKRVVPRGADDDRPATSRPASPARRPGCLDPTSAPGREQSGRCGHRCRRRRRRWPRPPPCTNVRNLAGPGAGGPVGVAAADVSGVADTPRRRPNPPPGACHAPPIGVAIDPLSRVEHRRPQSGDPPPDGAGPADADRAGLEDDPRPAAGARSAVRAEAVVPLPRAGVGPRRSSVEPARPGGINSRPRPRGFTDARFDMSAVQNAHRRGLRCCRVCGAPERRVAGVPRRSSFRPDQRREWQDQMSGTRLSGVAGALPVARGGARRTCRL